MRASEICLIVLSMAATLVSSRPSASYLTQSFRAMLSPSYKRQSSSVPPQCASTCDPIQNEVNAGYPVPACCTQSFGTSYYNCLLCVGIAMNTTDYTQAQVGLDRLYVSCDYRGYSFEKLTLPGQTLSRARTTSSVAKASTVAGTSATSVSELSTSVSAPTSISVTVTSQTTIPPSSALSASSGMSTSANSTTTSLPSTPATDSSAAVGLSVGGSGVWALVVAFGLIVLWNN
ncbi:hypothetical protein BD769DRAFT_979 [Suillus cothurnatus]|nr:hypothetical protein BD769DRAFT_979 [Suillus cothurnatus]